MKKKTVYILVAIAIIVIGYYLYKRHHQSADEPAPADSPADAPAVEENPNAEVIENEDKDVAPKANVRRIAPKNDDELPKTSKTTPVKEKVPRFGQRVITAVPSQSTGKKLIIDGKH